MASQFRGIMSIFEKFNTQGMSPDDAFEELCCQLFEYWGKGQQQFDGSWTYRNIRGTGGDGGVEAYWTNGSSTECYAVQAKWFRSTLTSSQWSQIKNSAQQAIKIRPYLTQYTICIPHNLTSSKTIAHGKTSQGEDEAWRKFKSKIEKENPGLEVVLWDENEINNLLVQHANEGLRRFWFEKTEVNPETFILALNKTISKLKARYTPEINEDGGLSVFLDKYLGSFEQQKISIDDMDGYLETCNKIASMIDSLTAAACLERLNIKSPESDSGVVEKAKRCKEAIECYKNKLLLLKTALEIEGSRINRTVYDAVGSEDINYADIEIFIDDVYKIKIESALQSHAFELKGAFASFRELPSLCELRRKVFESYLNAHCIVIGEQGTGKTCGLASKAQNYLCDDSHIPILVLASDIPENATWFEVIKKALGLSGIWDEPSMWQALSTYTSLRDIKNGPLYIRSKVAILIDGLDEKHSSYFWEDKIREGDAISLLYPRIRFVYSSRPWLIEKMEDKELAGCCYEVGANGDVPVSKLFDKYIEYFQIQIKGETQYRYLLGTPNELRLFCSVNRGRTLSRSVSTALSQLTAAEIRRLESELEEQLLGVVDASRKKPVSIALSCLSQQFMDKNSIDENEIEWKLSQFGISCQTIDAIINLLIRYGILLAKEPNRTPNDATSFLISLEPTQYTPGNRHLWDYCIAQRLIECETKNFKEIITNNQDAAMLYGVLLVEKKGILPSKEPRLLGVIDKDHLRQIDFYALSNANSNSVEKFKPWVMNLLNAGGRDSSDVINNLIVRVANYPDHPLGTALLNDYLSSFNSPIERDIAWSLPIAVKGGLKNAQIAFIEERRQLRNLPKLDGREKAGQMPLLFTWKLSSLSNLERSHYKRELIKWGAKNPAEFVCIFKQFCNSNDPQIREDIFAIAQEIICQCNPNAIVKQQFCSIAINEAFKCPDKQGKRDAAVRHYARLLLEQCFNDGLVNEECIGLFRPPYALDVNSSPLKISIYSSQAKSPHGFWFTFYNLTRHILIDSLASAFNLSQSSPVSSIQSIKLKRIMETSAIFSGIDEPLEFQQWVASAAFQYLLDHGFEKNINQGENGEDGYRACEVDQLINFAYDKFHHVTRSRVMTITEKYIWCARNEICGYLADRIPVYDESRNEEHVLNDTYCCDYRNLLSFESPLYEAAVMTALTKVRGKTPSFPSPFSCAGFEQLSKDRLQKWIYDMSPECAFAMLAYNPTGDTNSEIFEGRKWCRIVPIAIRSCDWGVNGKFSRIWIHGGAISRKKLKELDTGKMGVSDFGLSTCSFITGFTLSPSVRHIAPTEALAIPQIPENDELFNCNLPAGSLLIPLTGEGIDYLVGKESFRYLFPSKMARDCCRYKSTDGIHYYDNEGNTIFEEIRFGPKYRHRYYALLADKNVLQDALHSKGFELVWYVTLQRSSNSLASERLGCGLSLNKKSWLIWNSTSGEYKTCPISTEGL